MVPLFQHLFLPLLPVFPVTFYLGLNELVVSLLSLNSGRSPLFAADLSLQYCNKLPNFFEELSLYSIKLYISVAAPMFLALSTCVLFIWLMQSVNEAQFLNIWINIWIFCGDFIVILSVILLPIKSPVASVGFWNALSRFTAADFLIYSRSFSQLIYLDYIYSCLYLCFQQKKKKKIINFHNYTISKFNWITSHFLFVIP